MKSKCNAVIVTAVATVLALPAWAQFTGDNQTNIISGVTSNWTGNYYVGQINTGRYDQVQIINGGALSDTAGLIGYRSWSNSAVVAGSGSVWSNSSHLVVGLLFDARDNSLVISNGAVVYDSSGIVGSNTYLVGRNVATVTGGGSVWSNSSLYIGYGGVSNRLVISDGAKVFSNPSYVGYGGDGNSVLATGTGTVWNIGSTHVGAAIGSGNSLVISNGAKVFYSGAFAYIGEIGSQNSVLVTDPGSLWSNAFAVVGYGTTSSSNRLTIANGALVNSFSATFSGMGGSVLVTGSGSVWHIQDSLLLGYSYHRNTLTITNSGTVSCGGNLYVGFAGNTNALTIAGDSALTASNIYIGYNSGADGNQINVIGGSLYVTNALGNGGLDIRRGTLTCDGGMITTDRLTLTNAGVIAFNGGSLNTKATAVTDSQQFVVGNGTTSATFHLLGGVHSFNNGLRIRSNSFLTGCGTITGPVVIDAGGSVVADCGGALIFTGSVTNNGILHAQNGSVLEAYGPVVNNGIIDLMDGTTNFHSAFINNGTIVNASYFRVVSITREDDNMRITWPTVGGRSYVVQVATNLAGGYTDLSPDIAIPGTSLSTTNYLDLGGATNAPTRFYRIWLVP